MRKTPARIHFRSFSQPDVGLLGPWLEQAGLGAPPWVASETWGHRLMHDPRIVCRAACGPDDGVLGFFRMDIAPDRTAEITVVVSPDRRGEGVGKALLEGALEQARRLRVRRLVAVVSNDNRVALAMFEESGFDESGTSMPGFIHLERMVHSAEHQSPLEIHP